MPPKQRGEELRKIIKSVRDGTFEYKSKEPVKTDWAQYDQVQIYEMIFSWICEWSLTPKALMLRLENVNTALPNPDR